MVNTEIPKHYTGSPSSIVGTPHLTINREAPFDLDSSNAFEGPEKLLEVWFSPSAGTLPPNASPCGLKAVSAAIWSDMLDLVHCKVLSVLESEEMDAYLLSESSMFVFPHKLVLKTCGITTLLSGLPRILEIAALHAGFPHTPANLDNGKTASASTHRVFYSRKNYLYPDQQRGPHRSWRDEVRALDRLFRKGSAYMIGKMNGEHWYLYITDPDNSMTPPLTPPREKTQSRENIGEDTSSLASGTEVAQDETLEILMTDLEEENAQQFTLDYASVVAETQYFKDMHKARQDVNSSLGSFQGGETHYDADNSGDIFQQVSTDHQNFLLGSSHESVSQELNGRGHTLGTVVSNVCGLSEVYPRTNYPDARIDAYLFDPCGFSANGVVPAAQDKTGSLKTSAHYFTVHVTPEPECSYASFETNVPARQTGRETADIVEQVVSIFKPGRFSVTLFEAQPAVAITNPCDATLFDLNSSKEKPVSMESIHGYKRVDRIVHDLNGYDLVFLYFERHNFKGGAPRLGEMD